MKFLTRNDHVVDEINPGSLWQPEKRKLLIHAHNITPYNLLSNRHYHIFLKYAYANAFVQDSSSGKDIVFWRKLYDKMQIARTGIAKRSNFDKLIISLEKNGYNHSFPIPVDRRGGILDGSHRIAISMVFGIYPSIEIYNNFSHVYDHKWFLQNDFSLEELCCIDEARNSLLKKHHFDLSCCHIGIIWGVAFQFWNQIMEILQSRRLACAFWVDFFDVSKKKEFVIKSYQGDEMDQSKILAKADRLSRLSTKIGFFVLKEKNELRIREAKEVIREKFAKMIPNYFFDCIIHIIDCQKTAIELFKDVSRGRLMEEFYR